MTQTILFDNDGVLVDTEHLFFRASAEVLAGEGVALTEAEFIEVSLRRGESNFDVLRGMGYSDGEIAALRLERDDLYSVMLREEELVIEGVLETVAAMRGRVRMGIVTSCQGKHFDVIHEGSGLLELMDFVVVREEYPLPKPAPDAYRLAVERHGVDAAGCWVVEDSPRGLAAAKAAGLRCAVIPNRLTAGGVFDEADRLLESIRGVPGLFGL